MPKGQFKGTPHKDRKIGVSGRKNPSSSALGRAKAHRKTMRRESGYYW